MTTFFHISDQVESKVQFTPRNIIGITFFSSCFIIAILFFRIARKWRMLFVCWMKTESRFSSDDYKLPKSKWPLRKRVWIFTAIYISLAFIEHFLYFASVLVDRADKADNGKNALELFLLENFTSISKRLPIPNSVYLGLVLEYLNFSYTFYWNFLNLFIILISMGLSYLYETIQWRCESFRGLMINDSVWADIRNQHVKVSELTKLFNSHMNEMITIACFNDSYFLLSQMVNINV